MRFTLREMLLVTVIIALALGWAVDRWRIAEAEKRGVIDDSARQAAAKASEVRFQFFGLESEGIPNGFIVNSTNPHKIEECASKLMQQRDWQAMRGKLSANWGCEITFLDSSQNELWKCTTLGVSLLCEAPDGKRWNARFDDWYEWIRELTKVKELVKNGAPSSKS